MGSLKIKYIFLTFLYFALLSLELFAEGGSNNPEVTITPSVTVFEGNSGTKKIQFRITINQCPSLMPIRVKYTTQNGSAQAGEDYSSSSGSITFTPLACKKNNTKEISIKGDTKVESDERFYIQLSDNGTNSYQKYHFGNQRSTITIRNDDESQDADLAITKSNNKSSKVAVGEIVTYTIVGKNNGPKSSKIFIWDTLPDDLEFISVVDNSSNFSCYFSSSDRKIRCSGSRVFYKGNTVNITVKAKLLKNQNYRVRNYAGIQSADSPKKNDPNGSNNKAYSDIYTQSIDLKVTKKVKRKNGKFYKNASYEKGDSITFKVKFGNYDQLKSQIYFEDSVPSSLQIENFSINNKPNNFNCYINGKKITCKGTHQFTKNESVTLYINTKAIRKGRIYNWAKVSSPQGFREKSNSNNKSYAYVDIGLSGESITGSKTASTPNSGVYTIGDIVTFTITGVNHGSTNSVRIRDWLNKNGSTNGAFEFISVSNDYSYSATMQCEKRLSGYNFNIDCKSKSTLKDNQEFGIKLKVKLKKSGYLCNRAHFYKNVNGWIWQNSSQSCINVFKPKSKPILNADIFYLQLNQPDSIDLQYYTSDNDTPKSQLRYELLTPLPPGLQMTNDGLISGTYTDASGTFPKDFNVTVKVTDPDGLSSSDSFIIRIKATDIVANDNYYKIPIKTKLNGNLITDSVSGGDHPFNSDIGEGLTLISVDPNTNIQWNTNGSFLFKAPNSAGIHQYTYVIKDKYGQEDYALLKIEVYKPKIDAKDDILNVAKNTPLSVNIFSDNGNGVDVGDDIKVTSYTQPQHGALHIKEDGKLTYTPDNDYLGSDSVTYTITDRYGQTDSATIYFTVGAIHSEGYVDFYLVNPPKSRNIIGNYITIGNTVECITDKRGTESESNSFNGTCQNSRDLSNNDYVVRYIDIDGSSGIGRNTWNSSSATFTLPQSFLELNEGKGIVWAGLFWQGSVNNISGFKQRRASSDYGSPYGYKEIHNSEPINLASSGADRVLIRIDNDPAGYREVHSDTFYNDLAHGNFGGYYAAYTNITSLLQQMNLSRGEHTITVANIMTNEGREANIGNYGGWSLVIIYKEDMTGRPRNISIYNGYQPIGKGGNTNIPSKELEISGFKLPKSGEVESSISAFVGEGEKIYGGSSTVYDKMYIKDPNTHTLYNMPANDPNNIFDATIENIKRKSGSYNNILNSNGIDVDSYDVSNIMQHIRDNKVDTHKIIVGVISTDDDKSDGDQSDYVTASMLAFSTELYAPKVCYDYDLKLGKYIDVPSQERHFSTSAFANKALQVKLMLRSQEADFDLLDTKLSVAFSPNDVFKYKVGYSKYSPPNTFTYLNAIETDISKGEIAIGKNPTIHGGVLGAKETTYAKLYYDFLKPTFDGNFDIFIDSQISFDGITKVPYTMSTQFDSKSVFYIRRCDTNPVYNPVYGTFNVERGDSTISQSPAERYSLYTQVVGVPYSISVVSYGKDENGQFTKELANDATIELELIDGGTFENNSSAGYDSVCEDPDTYNKGTFIKFNHTSRVVIDNIFQKYPTYPKKLALKNAIFRTWVLTKDINGTKTIVNHNCSSQSDSGCFETLYNNIYKESQDKESKYCKNDCSSSSGTECYDCLRKHFAMPICSRDNFAIRPNSYSIELQDANQTDAAIAKSISINNGSITKKISAGYLYRLETNATQYNSRNSCDGYYYIADTNSSLKQSVALFNDLATCTDKNNSAIELSLLDGKSRIYGKLENNNSTLTKNSLIINNSGKYKIHIKDAEWTMVDHKGYKYKPFPHIADCIKDSSEAYNGQNNAKRGCVTQTNGATGTLPDLPISLHPYRFNLDSIALYANPNSSSNYIYINDLNSTIDQVKNGSVMALKLSGLITALGKNGKELSNYINGCSADNLTVALDYNQTPTDNNDTYGNRPKVNYLLYDAATDDANTTPSIHNEDNDTSITMSFNKKYFYTPSKGSFNSYYNIARAYNNPINPFKLSFETMNVSSLSEKISVDMQKNFIPSGQKDINSTKTLYFAKIKSKSDFYDDIYDDNVTTPIYVALYCNRSLNYCADYGIDTTKALTDEYDWWLSLNHNGTLEGQAILVSNPSAKASVTPTPIINFIDGVAKDVTVKSLDRLASNLPYTVYIDPDPLMINRYPWLLYNRFSNTPPKHIYKVRFVDSPAAWSGKGKTGHTINVDSTGRKSNKVDW